MRSMKTITPGEILLEEYLIPLGISQNALGRALGVSRRTINKIVSGKRSITPEMSMKLGRFFGQTSEFWFRVQSNCDFRDLRQRERALTAQVQPLALLKAA
jgi:addiction module HigA family antidote